MIGHQVKSTQVYFRVTILVMAYYILIYLFIAACNFKNLNLKEQLSIQDLEYSY